MRLLSALPRPDAAEYRTLLDGRGRVETANRPHFVVYDFDVPAGAVRLRVSLRGPHAPRTRLRLALFAPTAHVGTFGSAAGGPVRVTVGDGGAAPRLGRWFALLDLADLAPGDGYRLRVAAEFGVRPPADRGTAGAAGLL